MRDTDHRRHLQPARLLAAAFLGASALATASIGVVLGGSFQDRFEDGPTAAQEQVLSEIGAARRPTPNQAADPRGPNRADLGGGRADLAGGSK